MQMQPLYDEEQRNSEVFLRLYILVNFPGPVGNMISPDPSLYNLVARCRSIFIYNTEKIKPRYRLVTIQPCPNIVKTSGTQGMCTMTGVFGKD